MEMIDCAGLTEPFDVQEFRVTGIGRIERNDEGLLDVIFFRKKNGDRIVNVTLTVAQENVPAMLEALAQAIGWDMVATYVASKKTH
jgi:hypothetical protein